MQTTAKLIYRTNASYLPIAFPAVYYGMPNGRIYVIYSRFYEIKYSGSGLEFVFAVHKEFKYDYDREIIIPVRRFRFDAPIFSEHVDMPGSKITIIKIYRGLNSYSEAINLLNDEAREINGLNKIVSNVN